MNSSETTAAPEKAAIEAERLDSRLDDWRRRLLDLSLRNNLIKYRPRKNSSLEILKPDAAQLLRELRRRGSLHFHYPPDAGGDAPTDVGVDASLDPPSPPASDLIVTGTESRETLVTTLNNLHRRSASDYNEKALRVLYLGVGFLEWSDASRGETLESPLVLVPVELRRNSLNDPYSLHILADEDIVINPTLKAKIEADQGISLPEDWAWEDKELEEELDDVRQAVAGTDWRVTSRIVLSIFSFQKMVMFQDLKENASLVKDHPIIRSLALQRRRHKDHDRIGDIPQGGSLERARPPHESYSILDADSSQRESIEAARRGISFVMQGPPGTGKSQTIANIISEALGDGKRVLFVSEKIAALDVVYQRLAKCGLEELCMDLHGEKATRARVVNELHQACSAELRSGKDMEEAEQERLGETRDALDSIWSKLQAPRAGLHGLSVHRALGILASVQSAPVVADAPEPPNVESREAIRRYDEVMRQFRAAAAVWDLALDLDHPWRGHADPGLGSAETRTLIRRTEQFAEAAAHLARIGHLFATELALEPEPSIADVNRWSELGRLVADMPAIEPDALDAGARGTLQQEIDAAEAAHSGLAQREAEHRATYRTRKPDGFPENIGSSLGETLDLLERTIGRGPAWDESLPDEVRELAQLCRDAPRLLDHIETDSRFVAEELGQPDGELTVARARHLAELVRLAHMPTDRPDPSWLNRLSLEQTKTAFNQLQPKISTCQSLLKQIREDYREEIFEYDVEALSDQLRAAQARLLGSLRGPGREVIKTLQALRKDGKTPKNPDEDLATLRRFWSLYAEIQEAEADRNSLGAWDRGVDTDVESVARALERADEILVVSSPRANRQKLAQSVALGGEPSEALLDAGNRLLDACEQITSGFAALRRIAALRRVNDPETMPLNEVADTLLRLTDAVTRLDSQFEEVSNGMTNPAPDLPTLCEAAERIDRINSSHQRIGASAERWRQLFGSEYRGEETEWDVLRRTADWIERVCRLYPGGFSPSLRQRLLESAPGTWPDFVELNQALAATRRSLTTLAREFEPSRSESLRALIEEGRLDDLESLGKRLLDTIDSLPRWADLADATHALEEQGWGDYLAAAIEARLDRSQIEDSAKHAYWDAKLNEFFANEPELAAFKGSGHDEIVDEFRRLDLKLIETGASRVLSRQASIRKERLGQLGEKVDLISREAGKQRHRWSVKRLLSEIGELLQVLKPCLMMSPMTVSQFLSADHRFDLVIFDEASQVPPGDAINCIYRGDQLIVAGDSKQLPPTRFFTAQEQEEAEAEIDDEGKAKSEGEQEVMESILDACGTILPTRALRWHYRSRHEDLIAFSNRHFYGNDLETFPSPDRNVENRGINFIYVPDGIYDRGRSKKNRVEAKRVAERVFEHLDADPSRTLGVVTFSTPQRDAVSDALEMIRRKRPEMEHLFGDDRMEGLFVKNLEAVQGDERDVIIFSVGFGRDEAGTFSMNFGPLNKDGGERRLNVAVTRAREQVDVIASVRPEDFRIGPGLRPGVHRLRDYLDFAANGRTALLKHGDAMGGDFDSPFEQAVATAIRAAGYEVIPQVGCSGYRIDLGVVDPDFPGRFVLGVECDGATYHSSPAARDRDRLRQRILEGLGWEIHRIWSRDWTRNPESEIAALRERIESLRSHQQDPAPDENLEVESAADGMAVAGATRPA